MIPEDRRKQVSAIEKAAKGADDVYLATDLDREGEAIAWHVAEAANVPAARRHRVTFNEITEGAIREAFASPRDIDQQPRRRPAGAPHRRPPRRLHAEPAAVAQGPRRPVGRARAVGRGAPGRRARARDPRVHRPRVLDARGAPRDGRRARTFTADARADRRQGRSTSATARPPSGHAAALRAAAAGRRLGRDARSRSATRRRRSPPARSSRRRAASSASAPSGRCASPSGCTRASDTPDGHVGLITYMRTDSTAIAGVAMAEAQERDQGPLRRALRHRQGPRLQDEGQGRPGGARVDPADVLRARPGVAARGTSSPRSYRLYRLIWQRAIASQMAPKELETTTVELVGGRRTACGRRRRGRCSTASPGSTPRARTTTPPRRRSARCRRSPRATSRASRDVTPTQHFTEPPPRYTEATLIKALEEHGIGRPSTYAATISTIVDRGYVRIEERRLHPEEIGEIVTDLLVDALRRVRGPRVHGPHGGGARRGRPRRARVGPAAARVLRRRSRRASTRSARSSSGRTSPPRPTDEVCSRGPPDGHPPRPQREVPRLLAVPRAQGDAAAARRGGARSSRATASRARSAARATLTTKRGRFGAFVGCSRYPDCTYIRKDGPPPPGPAAVRGHLPQERRRAPRRASRAAHRQRLLGVLELPEVRLHHATTSRRARSTTSTTTARARSRDAARPACA